MAAFNPLNATGKATATPRLCTPTCFRGRMQARPDLMGRRLCLLAQAQCVHLHGRALTAEYVRIPHDM